VSFVVPWACLSLFFFLLLLTVCRFFLPLCCWDQCPHCPPPRQPLSSAKWFLCLPCCLFLAFVSSWICQQLRPFPWADPVCFGRWWNCTKTLRSESRTPLPIADPPRSPASFFFFPFDILTGNEISCFWFFFVRCGGASFLFDVCSVLQGVVVGFLLFLLCALLSFPSVGEDQQNR